MTASLVATLVPPASDFLVCSRVLASVLLDSSSFVVDTDTWVVDSFSVVVFVASTLAEDCALAANLTDVADGFRSSSPFPPTPDAWETDSAASPSFPATDT